jgi:hypothetical protein
MATDPEHRMIEPSPPNSLACDTTLHLVDGQRVTVEWVDRSTGECIRIKRFTSKSTDEFQSYEQVWIPLDVVPKLQQLVPLVFLDGKTRQHHANGRLYLSVQTLPESRYTIRIRCSSGLDPETPRDPHRIDIPDLALGWLMDRIEYLLADQATELKPKVSSGPVTEVRVRARVDGRLVLQLVHTEDVGAELAIPSGAVLWLPYWLLELQQDLAQADEAQREGLQRVTDRSAGRWHAWDPHKDVEVRALYLDPEEYPGLVCIEVDHDPKDPDSVESIEFHAKGEILVGLAKCLFDTDHFKARKGAVTQVPAPMPSALGDTRPLTPPIQSGHDRDRVIIEDGPQGHGVFRISRRGPGNNQDVTLPEECLEWLTQNLDKSDPRTWRSVMSEVRLTRDPRNGDRIIENTKPNGNGLVIIPGSNIGWLEKQLRLRYLAYKERLDNIRVTRPEPIGPRAVAAAFRALGFGCGVQGDNVVMNSGTALRLLGCLGEVDQ